MSAGPRASSPSSRGRTPMPRPAPGAISPGTRRHPPDRVVQGWTARLHVGAAQYRRTECARHRRGSDGGLRAVLLVPRVPPPDLAAAIDEAWARVRAAPGFLTEHE